MGRRAELGKSPLVALKERFRCPTCGKLLTDPLQFTGCSHAFCRLCILGQLEGPGITKSECPVCHQPAWKKDLKPNQQYQNISNILQAHLPSDQLLPFREGEEDAKSERVEAKHETQTNAKQKLQKKPQRQQRKRLQDESGKAKASRKRKQSGRKRSKVERVQAAELVEDFVEKQRQRLQQNFSMSELSGDQQALQSPQKMSQLASASRTEAERQADDLLLLSGETPKKMLPPHSSAHCEVIPDTPELSQAVTVSETPVIQLEEALSPRTAAKEAHEVCMILAEIQKVEGMLEHTRLSQLDNLLPDLGSEFVLNADCRTQRRLGDIDFEMISR